jgi:DeoR/GlpR family transcriptional regulator of sugar metabolism
MLKNEKVTNMANETPGVSAAVRKSETLALLERRGLITVEELSDLFQVSSMTIRRDLAQLEEVGLLKRIRGGAVRIDSYISSPPFAEKTQLYLEEKRRIGAKAASLIQPGEHVILHSGTTVFEVARNLALRIMSEPLECTVVTASQPVINELKNVEGVEVIVLGGIYFPELETVFGGATISQINRLYADRSFIAPDGITVEKGLSTFYEHEAEVARAVVDSSGEVTVVADSSKLGKTGYFTTVSLDKVDCLITDTAISEDWRRKLSDFELEVLAV